MFNNLEYFKGTQYNLNLELGTDNIWRGAVYFDQVSTGLYESVNIFLLEKVFYKDGTYLNKPISEQGITKFKAQWHDVKYSSQDIFLFDAKVEDNQLKVQSLDTVEFNLLSATNKTTDHLKHVDTLDNQAFQLNVAISSTQEGRHERILFLYGFDDENNRHTIAEIKFYGEVVGEDERLTTLLSNLGATLEEGDFLLFKDHDIKEQSPDQILLNRKRKELLLELSNIKPFIGTYKALNHAIDFFGYNNLTVKEYWVNVDKNDANFGKFYAVPVPNSSKYGDQELKSDNVNVPSNKMKKTNRFNLVYKINVPNNEFDQFDLPQVDEVFEFTPQEVLIKLYGLKNKLQKEYLPLKSRIIEIVGEGTYFTQTKMNVWENQNPITYINEGHNVQFDVFPNVNKRLFIEDISHILKTQLNQDSPFYHKLLNTQFGQFHDLNKNERETLISCFHKFYNNYYNLDLSTFNKDIPVGCPIILDARKSFLSTINDIANTTWNDMINPNDHLTLNWNNWWKKWVYEIEWVIKGPRDYEYSFIGPIDDYLQFPLILPYNGSYDVELRLYDLFGHMSYYRKSDYIQVELKEIELYGIYKWFETYNIANFDQTWNEAASTWDLPIYNNMPIDDHIATMYLTMDRANYLHDESNGVSYSLVRRFDDPFSPTGYYETTGPYRLDNCNFTWEDSNYIWWDATYVGPDLSAAFKINDVKKGSILEIEYTHKNQTFKGTHTIKSDTPIDETDINAWLNIAKELNNSSDPIINKFNYNPIYLKDSNKIIYVLAVAKISAPEYDYDHVNLSLGEVVEVNHHKTYNPTLMDTQVFKSQVKLEKSTHVTISADISRMPGMKNPIWEWINNDNPEYYDIYSDSMWLTYIFQQSGNYSIKLSVEDTNGNVNTKEQKMLNIK